MYLCHGVDFSALQLPIHLGKSFYKSRVAMTACVLIQQRLLGGLGQSIDQERWGTEVGKPLRVRFVAGKPLHEKLTPPPLHTHHICIA